MCNPESTASDALPLREINSAELLQGAKVVIIEHAGQNYRLLVTKNDKLILQK